MPKNEVVLKEKETSQALKYLSSVPISLETLKQDEFNNYYLLLEQTIKSLSALKEDLDAEIKEVAKNNYLESGKSSVSSDQYMYTYVSMILKESLDTKKLKEERPDIYKQYVKVSSVKDSIRIKQNTKEKNNGSEEE